MGTVKEFELNNASEKTVPKNPFNQSGNSPPTTPTSGPREGAAFDWGDSEGPKIQVSTVPKLAFPVDSFSGLTRRFADAYSKYMESPFSFLVMAFLTVLGVLIANRVTLRSQIHPQSRLYTVLVGESGDDRKSECIRQVIVFFKTFLEKFLKYERFAFTMCEGAGSAEGLAAIFKKISMLLVYDELKSFVSKAQIETSVLLQGVNSLFDHNSFESATKKRPIQLRDARLSVLAASTRETYERMWTPAFLDIGFINRLFVVTGTGIKRFAIPQIIPESEMEGLFNGLAEILDFVNKIAGDGVYEMPIDEDARLLFEKWYLSTPREKYYKRLDTYGHRLMILLSVNECLNSVTRETVQKVIDILDWQAEVRRDTVPIEAETMIAKIEGAIKSTLTREGGSLKKWKLERACHKERFGAGWWNLAIKGLSKDGEILYHEKTKAYFLKDPEKDE
jgi:hypothetical protein